MESDERMGISITNLGVTGFRAWDCGRIDACFLCEYGDEMEINTKRLTLRPIQLGDETEIHEYAGDKGITMMFFLPNDNFVETCDFVKRNVSEWQSADQTDFD